MTVSYDVLYTFIISSTRFANMRPGAEVFHRGVLECDHEVCDM